MNNNEFEYSEKTKRRVRIFKRILSFIVLILAIATMVALFYVKKEKMRVRLFFSLLQYIAMSIVLISPRLLKKFANFEVPVEVHISVTAFAFLGLVLGDGLNFYGKIGWWDSLLHFTSVLFFHLSLYGYYRCLFYVENTFLCIVHYYIYL